MHHIDIFLENGQFLTKNQIPLALSIKKLRNSIEKGKRKIKKWKKNAKNWKIKNHWPCWPGNRSFEDRSTSSSGLGILRGSRAHFSTLFSSVLQWFSLVLASKDWFQCVFKSIDLILGEIWGLWRLGFPFWVIFSSFNGS